MTRRTGSLSTADAVTLWIVVFFLLVSFTLEAHWVFAYRGLAARTDWAGTLWAYYGAADAGYYDRVTPFVYALESLHVFVTSWAYLLIAFGILKRRSFRLPLQLVVGSYVCYSTCLYLLANHLSGYAGMREHTVANLLMLYLVNLPWVVGNLYLAAAAGSAITQAFRQSLAVTEGAETA